jgi:hypothetical protein
MVGQSLPVYGWVACFAKTRAHFLGGGFRYFGVNAVRPQLGGDPPIDVSTNTGFDTNAMNLGENLFVIGTSLCFPIGARPAFLALRTFFGNHFLGSSVLPTFDDMNAMFPTDGSFTTAAAGAGTLGEYIQNGMGGVVPRPEITGNDLRALCYFVRRHSLAGSYPTTASPGPRNPDIFKPVISNVIATRVSPTSVRVTWNTDKPTIGMAAGGSAFSATTNTKYSAWSPIESGFGTSHDCTITSLPTSSPIHYTVISKDIAGNFQYIDNRTVT